jgi:DNA polymerase-1
VATQLIKYAINLLIYTSQEEPNNRVKEIYIIDAVNYLFRSYYAIGNMTNGAGKSTGALYGFIRSVQKLFKDFSPDHAICVFDGPDNKKSRQAVYAEYKMHRKGAPEDLFPQFEWAYEYCELAGIPTLCVPGVEADDTMAAIAVWAEKTGSKAFLCSSDKDLMQLVDDHIFMLHAHKNNLLVDAQKVEELFGVRPNQMLDLLSIMGDSSDNIPGLEGFGPKTAAALLQEFGTLDNILEHPEKVKGEKKQETLRTQKSVALMSRDLATLDLSVEIPRTQEFYRLKQPAREKLIEFFHSMKFNSLLREIGEPIEVKEIKTHAPEVDLKESSPHTQGKREEELSFFDEIYHLITTDAALNHLLKDLKRQKNVCIDTETTGKSPFLSKLVGIGFGYKPGESWYVPCNGPIEEKVVTQALIDFFKTASCAFYGHNIKYDLHILARVGIELKNIGFDTLVASYLLNPHIRRHNLDELVLERFKKIKIPIETLIGKGKEVRTMLDVPIEQVKDYCCEDVDYTCRLKELLSDELKNNKPLETLFSTIELPLLSILAKMEKAGIYLNVQKIHALGEVLNADLQKLKTIIWKEVGLEFNLNSPKQLSKVLFETLQLKPPAKKRTEFSTGADVLEILAVGNPIVQNILKFRSLEKLRSTYAETLPELVNPHTKRIHCTFNQSIAATGRLSCQDPNLQNIPVRTEQGLAIRACFEPQKPNWYYIGADYSQIELRLLAHFSQDPELIKAFKEGEDVHIHTASLVFDVPPSEVTPEMRSNAKTVNFGIIYGQGAYGLSQQLGISVGDASDFIKKYFERYPKISAYLDACKREARKTGYATTLTGRQRPIPEITNQNHNIRMAAERLAINTPLQGTAADLIKMAMIEIDKTITNKKLEGQMILQIHDELIFEVPEKELPVFEQFVRDKMEHVIQLNVPIEVHIAIGKNWAEC